MNTTIVTPAGSITVNLMDLASCARFDAAISESVPVRIRTSVRTHDGVFAMPSFRYANAHTDNLASNLEADLDRLEASDIDIDDVLEFILSIKFAR